MIRFVEDNVLVKLEPLNEKRGVLEVVRNRQNVEQRWARVIACGPGHYTEPSFQSPRGAQVPLEVLEGDMVLVTSQSGHDYKLDLSVPRQNEKTDFEEMFGEYGEYRVIRGEEALARQKQGVPPFSGSDVACAALGRFVLVQREVQRQTAAGLYIPENTEEKSLVGTVLSMGRGRPMRDGSFRQIDVKPGQRVLFGQYVGMELTITGVPGLVLLRDEDVMGVYEEKESA
jgi:chaperonin GroES